MQVLLEEARLDANARTHGQLTPLHLAVACTENPLGAVRTTQILLKQVQNTRKGALWKTVLVGRKLTVTTSQKNAVK